MGMLVKKGQPGFGPRSWRYAAIIDDEVIEKWFEEPGREDDCADDPYGENLARERSKECRRIVNINSICGQLLWSSGNSSRLPPLLPIKV